MCAINGILRLEPDAPPPGLDELLRTRDAMRVRGPDGEGHWVSPRGDLALGHRRLAIIDLSEAGAQPMSTPDGRYHIVFNGEIYNYRELREELERAGHALRSHSDTEVLLRLFALQGVAAFGKLRGMYAVAIWDDRERRLVLARDPCGIKPLYYAAGPRYLRFASQVKALDAGGGLCADPEPAAVVGFLLWGAVPEPHTIRKGVRAVPAGHCLTFGLHQAAESQPIQSPADDQDVPGDPLAAVARSVEAHLVSDVPVGVFLSSGLDSALVAALACRSLKEPPVAFTLRFREFIGTDSDEMPGASEVAEALGLRHLVRTTSRGDFLEYVGAALDAMDQPSIDGFNSYVVSRAAKEAGMKVALSGLGGDELFGGYRSFAEIPRLARWVSLGRRIPGSVRICELFSRLDRGRPKLRGLLKYGGSFPGAYFMARGLFLPEELPALVGRDLAADGLAAYDAVADVERALNGSAPAGRPGPWPADAWQAVRLMESGVYLRNQLLRDTDWASMANSLEVRVPLVDVVLWRELGRAGFEPARSEAKAAVVRRLAPALPPRVFTRRKSGFSIPVVSWLQGAANGHNATPLGLQSRWLACEMLRRFGVEVDHAA